MGPFRAAVVSHHGLRDKTIRDNDHVISGVARQLTCMTWLEIGSTSVIQTPAPNGRSTLIAGPASTSQRVFHSARPRTIAKTQAGTAVFLDTGAGKGGHLSWIDLP
jgi:hypothetical protein